MPKNRKPQEAPTANARPSRLSVLWPLLCLIGFAIVVSLVVAWIATSEDGTAAKSKLPAGQPVSGEAPGEAVRARLAGRWFRPDGDYIVEIRRVQADGKLDARYLNPSRPRPVNVARAQATRQGERTSVYVELDDEGYRGSYYNLVYNAADDRLAGSYVQKEMNQKYEVTFMRLPEDAQP